MLGRILDGSDIDRLVPCIRSILGARGCWMLELVEGFLNVCGNGYFTSTFVIFPIKGDTTIELSSPVDGNSIQLLESLDDMVSSFFADLFDTEVINHKGETYFFCGMLPKGRGSRDGGLEKLGKVDLEPIVCNAAGLFQDWHAFADIQVHPYVGCKLRRLYWALIYS